MDSNKFDFTYSAPTEEERREIESIKKQYMPAEDKDNKLNRLRDLNKRVTQPPLIIALTIGIVGILVMGAGMAMTLEFNMMVWGIIVGVLGIAIVVAAYPIYKAILKRNKQKYGQQIIDLSNELLNEDANNK